MPLLGREAIRPGHASGAEAGRGIESFWHIGRMDTEVDPRNPAGIRVGDIYEDCSFHPVLCTDVEDVAGLVLGGVSLIDGSSPRNCDALYCQPVRIEAGDVMAIKRDFQGYVLRRKAALGEAPGGAAQGRSDGCQEDSLPSW